MRQRWPRAALGILLVGVVRRETLRAEEQPAVNLPPEICELSVKADPGSGDALLSWSGGTPPFVVVRGDAGSLDEATKVEYLSMNVAGRRFLDSGALRKGHRFYYQVYDHNSVPEVFTMTPDDPHEGDVATIRGIGFSRDCARNIVVFDGGLEVRPRGKCDFTGFQFTIPLGAVSGSLMFVSPNGVGGFGDHQSYRCDGMPRSPATW